MRIAWPWLAWSLVAVTVHGQQQQQVPFDAVAHAGNEAPRPPPPQDAGAAAAGEPFNPLSFSQPAPSLHPSQSAADLHALALTLLTQITTHSTSVASIPYAPLLQPSSYTPFLDLLEAHLGPTAGRGVRAVRRAIGFISGRGSSFSVGRTVIVAEASRGWSIRGTIGKLGAAVTNVIRLNPNRGTTTTITNEDGQTIVTGTAWRERLKAMGSRSGKEHLTVHEVREGMNEVVALAREAGERGSAEAWVLVGDLLLTGHLTLKANVSLALEAHTKASERHGSPEAQYKLGFLYGSNYGSATGDSEGGGHQGNALLHYTFAGLSGHVPASMTVGYRHWVGIGTKQSCKDALGWYKRAADAAMITFNAGPPGGRLLPSQKTRLSDLEGGTYGPGASASVKQSSGVTTIRTQQEWRDLLEFHHFHAESDITYMFRLGRLYYQGFGGSGLGGTRGGRGRLQVGMPGLKDDLWEGGRNFREASKWFMRVAMTVWATDGKEAMRDPGKKARDQPRLIYDGTKDPKKTNVDDSVAMVGGLAAGYLGRMYLRGEGAVVNHAKAFLWFSRGALRGDRESSNGLGLMYRDGLGVKRDLKRANLYFQAAAQQDLAEAQVNLGKYHFGVGDFVMATTYFEHAIRQDNNRIPDTFQSYYYLAELNARAPERPDQCLMAVSFYKLVAERGDWDHEVWWEAERAWQRGDEHQALLGYWIMAERGYEQAQNNVAWILDRDKQRLRVPFIDVAPADNSSDRLALAYWTRSAAQDNVDALVKMGDYYYKGIGNEAGPNVEKAASCYLAAVNTRTSAMAMWNLGWMHEHGQGVPKDYVMAKRYYDMALENSYDAYLPSVLSLLSLYARAFYHVVFPTPTDGDLKAKALFASGEGRTPALSVGTGQGRTWSFSQAWREIRHRWGFDPPPQDNAAQGAAQGAAGAASPPPTGAAGTGAGAAGAGARGQAAPANAAAVAPREDVLEAQRALEAGDDPLDWQRGGRDQGDGEDEFYFDGEDDLTGTVAIVALCMLLGWLLYFRQGQQMRNQQLQQQQQQPVAARPNGQAPPAPTPAATPTPAAQPAPTGATAQNEEEDEVAGQPSRQLGAEAEQGAALGPPT